MGLCSSLSDASDADTAAKRLVSFPILPSPIALSEIARLKTTFVGIPIQMKSFGMLTCFHNTGDAFADERLRQLGRTLIIEATTVENLVREGFHRTLGARPMRNTVDRFLQETAAREMLAGSV